ncbi:hypothetical protein C8A00DRAFT_30807 [Chaetomidium leptoderma]|uniref:Uncharacterized protein n=1 Tax=Chaetomidium leptoderma TaxID=669021 RepID=A0AAN6VS95_9PEZI|nr:hypothetical protein C8A00DRAFT_30807 [Chaetomidium leptoderma]
MADNTSTNWFRSFGRSSSSIGKQPPPPSLTTRHSGPLTLDTRHDTRHIFHRAATPTHSPTTESPPRRSHHHRKSAGATLRTVSSFLNIKSSSIKNGSSGGSGGGSGGGGGNGGGGHLAPPAPPAPSRPEHIRPPAPMAMLPLTEVDYGGDDHDGCRSRSGSGSAWGGTRQGEEETWHNPNLMQMAEMLSAVMARRGAGEGLDVAYNSCVLSLIEGFYHLTRKLRDTEEKLTELKDLRERELEQFRGMTEEWVETGEAYKAEVKRLELALAKESKDGVASVALARHGSLVDRAGSKRFHARLKRLGNSRNQDALAKEQVSPFTEEPVDLAEATSSYRTLGAIPRILDSVNDVSLSQLLQSLFIQAASLDPAIFLRRRLEAMHLMAQLAPSTDNESSSSDSSTHTEMRSAQPAFTLSDRSNGRPEKAKENHSDSSAEGIGQRNGEGELPRQRVNGGHPSLQEPSQSPPQDKKQRRRRYSFEKGDDEILPMTPLTLAPEFPAGEEMTAQLEIGRFLTVTSGFGISLHGGGGDTDPTATPTSDFDSGSVKHSSSTNTVKWVGNGDGDGNGSPNKGGNAEHGETEDTG